MQEASVIKNKISYVTRIILNNPANGNAVNNDNLSLIYNFIVEAINDPETRIIVIQGKDKIFCRGMDFKNLINTVGSNDKLEIKNEWTDPYKNVVKILRNSPKPVIAAIDGEVLAGGMGLALACDIVIATKSSIFGLSEVLFGIIPAFVFPFLMERVSYKRARYLILSSKKLSAEEACQYGIVDELVDDNLLEKKLKDIIKRLLYSSPDALTLTKEYSDKLTDNKIDQYVDFAQNQLTALLNNKENIETIKSFLDGEKPKWAVSYKSN